MTNKIPDDVVEAVARAIWAQNSLYENNWQRMSQQYMKEAQAAITALMDMGWKSEGDGGDGVMSEEAQAILDVLYPYIHSKKKRWIFLPNLKTKLMKIYPQSDGGKVLEIRIHEFNLIKARKSLAAILSKIESTARKEGVR